MKIDLSMEHLRLDHHDVNHLSSTKNERQIYLALGQTILSTEEVKEKRRRGRS